MNWCKFTYGEGVNKLGWPKVVCTRCGHEQFAPDPPERCGRMCDVPEGGVVRNGPCLHLGPEVRQQECQECRGKVRMKIYACEVFGECSLGKPLAGVQYCVGCPRYEAIPRAEAAASDE
jgi:hypothetical protein